MSHRFASLMVASLTLAASPHALMSASSIRHPLGDIEILVDGAPVPRYAHGGRWYVEALKGREYAIRMHNPHAVRVAVALSVDGLNTIDGRVTTAADARKWIIGPHETVTISGWQTSQREARRFEFTTEAGSYGQALGKTANLGVISAVFFRERVRAVMAKPSRDDDARREASPPRLAGAEESNAPASQSQKADNEYAATGMGRPTDHAVTQVWLDLEEAPVQTVNVRYEFRDELVRLGILSRPTPDPLVRRERAQGFEPGFCPEPPR
jgi:hypothetical protein